MTDGTKSGHCLFGVGRFEFRSLRRFKNGREERLTWAVPPDDLPKLEGTIQTLTKPREWLTLETNCHEGSAQIGKQ